MTSTARGKFQVKMDPQIEPQDVEGVSVGRMSLDKQYEGDLAGRGKGEMLTALTPVQGSAGYVALERVTGRLDGRKGSFVLQHHGIMNQGAEQLTITVVPGSGTGALAGILGTCKIEIVDGEHFYALAYRFSE